MSPKIQKTSMELAPGKDVRRVRGKSYERIVENLCKYLPGRTKVVQKKTPGQDWAEKGL